MNKDLEKKLFDRFEFYGGGKQNIMESAMGWGFTCGDGWFDLIWRLSEDIEKLVQKTDKEYKEYPFAVTQVKEKFGALRWYTNWATDAIFDRIGKAMKESTRTCEQCGKRGKRQNDNSWIVTACNSCFKKLNAP